MNNKRSWRFMDSTEQSKNTELISKHQSQYNNTDTQGHWCWTNSEQTEKRNLTNSLTGKYLINELSHKVFVWLWHEILVMPVSKWPKSTSHSYQEFIYWYCDSVQVILGPSENAEKINKIKKCKNECACNMYYDHWNRDIQFHGLTFGHIDKIHHYGRTYTYVLLELGSSHPPNFKIWV